jgi:hypothetical protein
MLLHLKQMTGRLIRSEEDRGIAVIVEGRTRRSYFPKLARALPPELEVRVVPVSECSETIPLVLDEIGLLGPKGSAMGAEKAAEVTGQVDEK